VRGGCPKSDLSMNVCHEPSSQLCVHVLISLPGLPFATIHDYHVHFYICVKCSRQSKMDPRIGISGSGLLLGERGILLAKLSKGHEAGFSFSFLFCWDC
jgi:hypothetical protein